MKEIKPIVVDIEREYKDITRTLNLIWMDELAFFFFNI